MHTAKQLPTALPWQKKSTWGKCNIHSNGTRCN